ncbi:hypothetical protein FIBSPDRAFT_861704, partial [Athelia psychrophila]
MGMNGVRSATTLHPQLLSMHAFVFDLFGIAPEKPHHRFALPRSNMMLYLRDLGAYAIDGKARVLDQRRASQRRI